MQTVVIATAILSVCLSVCSSVPCFVQTNEHAIVRSSASGRTTLLVSEEVKLIRIFPGDDPSDAYKVRLSHVDGENLTNNRL